MRFAVSLLTGFLTLAYVITGMIGLVNLVVFWNWTGFWQWTLISLGLAVVRFVFMAITGGIFARQEKNI